MSWLTVLIYSDIQTHEPFKHRVFRFQVPVKCERVSISEVDHGWKCFYSISRIGLFQYHKILEIFGEKYLLASWGSLSLTIWMPNISQSSSIFSSSVITWSQVLQFCLSEKERSSSIYETSCFNYLQKKTAKYWTSSTIVSSICLVISSMWDST